MFRKLVVLVLAMGLLGSAVLANRQQRIRAAHEMAASQRRLIEHDRALWRLRSTIAAGVTPDQVRLAVARLGPMEPLRTERVEQMLARQAAASSEASLTGLDAPPAGP